MTIEIKRTRGGCYYIERDGECIAGGLTESEANAKFNLLTEIEKPSWKPISQLPKKYFTTKKMFVVKAIDVYIGEEVDWKYTSDPYCVWREPSGRFARWPHPFQPTHFMELPE